MPRGGPRPGAGRPKGSGTKGKKAPAQKAGKTKKASKPASRVAPYVAQDPSKDEVLVGEVMPANMNPLEYMLHVMNNHKAQPDRRDRMAVAAAPYVHGKVGEQGKKVAKDAAAATVGGGNRFSAAPPPRRNRVN